MVYREIKTFKDLKVWKRSHELVLLVYKLSNKFPDNERYGLTSQIRRATLSIASNIVEGFARRAVRDSLKFYVYSLASLEEVKYQGLVAKDLNYMNVVEYIEFIKCCDEVGKMLNGWMSAQKVNCGLL